MVALTARDAKRWEQPRRLPIARRTTAISYYNQAMDDRSCDQCSTPVPRRARFCPRCGHPLSDPLPVRPERVSREIVVGWVLWIGGGLLVIMGLAGQFDGRTWLAIGLGIAAFVTGLGTLVGDSSSKPPRKRRKARA